MQEKRIVNARTINKMRCIVGLILCSIVIILTTVSFTLNIVNFYNESTPEAGIGTLRMYTTISNILATLAASICIPFQIDGLRRDKYKLPRWVVEVMYVGAVGVFLTFVIAILLVGPTSGFVYAMFTNSNLFMHTLNPLFITILFTVAISEVRLKFRYSFITAIPAVIYAFLYFIMVFVTKIWRDHYHLADYMPWPLAFVIFIISAFLIAILLGFLHNLTNKAVNKNIEKYYKESPDYQFNRVTDAIAKLAREEAKYYNEDDEIYIPVDIIKMLSDRYQTSTLPLDIQYDIYLENYLKTIKEKRENKLKEKLPK